MSMYLLIDGNNFYVSCERVFNPRLEHKPVVVLSNNDGCIVARSAQSKLLGIKMGQPMFEVKELIKKHRVEWLSSNYPLYSSMSERMMRCIEEHCSRIDIYSIDEAFVDVTGLPEKSLIDFASRLRHTVTRWTGIPVCVGIGHTKTLAKMANSLAKASKEHEGVFSLVCPQERQDIFKQCVVQDVWGIGRRTTAKLNDLDIKTVHELVTCPMPWIRSHFGLGLVKTVQELQGTSCIDLNDMASKKAISSSRSFSRPVTTLEELSEALSTYAAIAAGKCRSQKGLAQGICVYITTSRFRERGDFYAKQQSIMLTTPSNDTTAITQTALTLLKGMFRPKYEYAKCGIILLDILPETYYQADIFTQHSSKKSSAVMKVLDTINQKYGKSTIHLAAEGFKKEWIARSNKKSPNYTTQWSELPIARCK